MDSGVCGGMELESGVGADEVAVLGMASRGTGSAGVLSSKSLPSVSNRVVQGVLASSLKRGFRATNTL